MENQGYTLLRQSDVHAVPSQSELNSFTSVTLDGLYLHYSLFFILSRHSWLFIRNMS